MTRKNKTYISTEEFIKSYVAASTAEEAAKKLGVDVKYVLRRSNQLRNSGVKVGELPSNHVPLRSGRKSIDAEHINRLVKECQNASLQQSTGNQLTTQIDRAINNADN